MRSRGAGRITWLWHIEGQHVAQKNPQAKYFLADVTDVTSGTGFWCAIPVGCVANSAVAYKDA
jgi:hypothetical protein